MDRHPFLMKDEENIIRKCQIHAQASTRRKNRKCIQSKGFETFQRYNTSVSYFFVRLVQN